MSTRPQQGKPSAARSAREAAAAARAEEEARRRRERTVRITAIVVVLVLVAAGTVFAVLRSRVDQGAAVPTGVAQQGGPISLGGGSAGAKVPVLDIWEDFQCPYCQRFEAADGKLISSYAEQGKIKVNYHIVSFLGPESVRAANAAGCASDAKVFPAFHAELYANQPQEGTGGYTSDQLIAFGKKVGASSSEFQQCVRNMKYAEWVKAVQQNFDKAGLRGTPTVMLDGKTIDLSQLEPGTFKGLLDAAVK